MIDGLILAGEYALSKTGLITLSGGLIQAWTLCKITPITEGVPVAYYFNPYADKDFYISGKFKDTFLVPTQERALVEYMIFSDYFSEEFLIEGIQLYEEGHNGDLSKLWEVVDFMKLREDIARYWIAEAQSCERL